MREPEAHDESAPKCIKVRHPGFRLLQVDVKSLAGLVLAIMNCGAKPSKVEGCRLRTYALRPAGPHASFPEVINKQQNIDQY